MRKRRNSSGNGTAADDDRPAYAAQTRTVRVTPSISFSGSTATCKVNIRGEKATDVITATVTLWRDGSTVRSWNATAMGTLSFTGTAAAVSGSSYRLVVAYSINGETSRPTAFPVLIRKNPQRPRKPLKK